MALGTDPGPSAAKAIEALSNGASKPPVTIANALTMRIDFALNIISSVRLTLRTGAAWSSSGFVRSEEVERRRTVEASAVHQVHPPTQ
jgi:hypothetical protein